VVDAVIASSQIDQAWICEGTELGPKNCFRPAVSLAVSADAFDAFFNSPGGYRAEYFASPERGQAANGSLFAELEPKLTRATIEQCGADRPSRDWIRNAFLANSAKIWPDEGELDFTAATLDLAIGAMAPAVRSAQCPKGCGSVGSRGHKAHCMRRFH
jgi:hypothetical protein